MRNGGIGLTPCVAPRKGQIPKLIYGYHSVLFYKDRKNYWINYTFIRQNCESSRILFRASSNNSLSCSDF